MPCLCLQFRDRLLAKRLENPKPGQHGDFLENILNAKNADGSLITLDEVKTECFVLIVAASDTTSAFFCGFLRYVLETPGVYDKLVAEIDDFDSRGLLRNPVPLYDEVRYVVSLAKYIELTSPCHRSRSCPTSRPAIRSRSGTSRPLL